MKTSLLNILAQIKTSLLNLHQQGRLITIAGISVVIIIGLLWALLSPPAKKPAPAPTPKITEPAQPEDYLICVASQQMTTGYTEPSWGPPASSGKGYFIGSIAVHPRVASQWGGDPRIPRIPFGTAVYLLDPPSVKINNKWYDTLIVNDTGDINLGLWSEYPYWLDIYFGPTASWSNSSARAYGTQKVDYYWIEKWR